MNNQTESPFNNPRFLMVLAVLFFGMWGWQYYINKKYPKPITAVQQASAPQQNESVSATTNISDNTNLNDSQSQGAQINPTLAKPTQAVLTVKTLHFENEDVSFDVSNQGLGIINFTLKKYTDRSKNPIVFSSLNAQAELKVNDQGLLFDLTENKVSDSVIEYNGVAEVEGKKVLRKLTFNVLTLSFLSETEFDSGLKKISFSLFQNHQLPKSTSFLTPSFEQQDFIFIEAGSVKDENISGLKLNEQFVKQSPAVSLGSIGTQYFVASAINKSDIIPSLTNKVEANLAQVIFEYSLLNTQVNKLSQLIYLGPKKPAILLKVDEQLPAVLNYGMFGFIAKPLLALMSLLHGILGNWGLAIIVLTLIVRTVLLPFNVMSFRSAQAMQKLKPKLDIVREKFKDDPLRMNKETMAIMKENKANPLSGCLPMLLQIPIFFALWKAIGSSIDIYQQPFLGWITDLSYHDPYFVFPVLMGITMYFQQKLTPTTMDATQAKILSFMPIVFTLFMLTLPSGLTLYNFVSALFGVIQQYFLLKENKVKTPQLV